MGEFRHLRGPFIGLYKNSKNSMVGAVPGTDSFPQDVKKAAARSQSANAAHNPSLAKAF